MDFFLPYKCPASCSASSLDGSDVVSNDADAGGGGGVCYAQTQCDDYASDHSGDVSSPLQREANQNALFFVILAVTQLV